MDDFELELKMDFLTETSENLASAESAFLDLENDPSNRQILDVIFRLAHNLKGTSRAVGLGAIAELTHVAENLILKLKEGTIPVDAQAVSALLQFNDKVVEMVEALKNDINAVLNIDETQALIQRVIDGTLPTEEENTPPPEAFTEMSEEQQPISDPEIEISPEAIAALEDLEKMDSPKEIESSGHLHLVPPAQSTTVSKAPENKQNTVKAPVAEEETLRVALSRLEKLSNTVGELVILQTVLDQRRFQFIQDDLSNKSIGQLSKLSKEIQEVTLSLRMVPVKTTFQKMNRIVRDTSKVLNKEVVLHLAGENTEIDKTVLEKMGDPLVHIVRNAVDHGLETTEGRLQAGKNPVGNVYLTARHEGNALVIEVRDDGRGINLDVIGKKAKEKGLIKDPSTLSEEQILNLLFHPGFSTKEQVTEVSGRGVGMDVVKTNIESLGGKVKIETKLGQGSTFTVQLPLTLAIIEGMIVTLGAHKFIVPLIQVSEFVTPSAEQLNKVTGGGTLLHMRGEVMPVFDLAQTLNVQNNDNAPIVLVIRSGKHPYGIAVGDVVGQQQVVIKKLGDDIKDKKGFMGSAILGDGKPALILDLNQLFELKMKANQSEVNLKKYFDHRAA